LFFVGKPTNAPEIVGCGFEIDPGVPEGTGMTYLKGY